MVVPLAVTALGAGQLPQRLCSVITVLGKALMLVPFEAAPLDKRHLKSKVATVRDRPRDIVSAVDAVLSGL